MHFLLFKRISSSENSEAMLNLFSFELTDIALVGLIFLGYLEVFGAGPFSGQLPFGPESRFAILSTPAGKSL